MQTAPTNIKECKEETEIEGLNGKKGQGSIKKMYQEEILDDQNFSNWLLLFLKVMNTAVKLWTIYNKTHHNWQLHLTT